ncbi:MAG TPA: glycosyltransferase family 4 protein [Tepidisphaeraceae bacterium]|nr:glycosyltransferase family 4 protein [Tepidisphaeraceae bacterium]
MRIVHVSTSDSGGGAARAAYRLHSGLKRLGQDSRMLVLRKGSGDATVSALKPQQGFLAGMARKRRAGKIWRDYERYRPTLPPGIEPFSDDRSEHAGEVARQLPGDCDVINLHWIGGFLDWTSFFDAYPKHAPLVWRLADMGALTGGCHYDQGCGKFLDRCGACPQLGSSDNRDLSRDVWHRKRDALARVGPGGLHIVGTSRWIAGEAKRSSLFGGFPVSVIPNGLDVEEFSPRDKHFSRELWGIPRDAKVVLFAAESMANVRKGFRHLADAVAGLGAIGNLWLVSVGGGTCELPAGLRHLSLGKVSNDRMLSTIYSAADVFVIPSLQESFGQTVIESLACGTAVVGFASGGIPDMVRPGQTGWLAPTGDTAALRDAIGAALTDDARRAAMGVECRRVAVQEYSMDVQSRAYLRLYETLVAHASEKVTGPAPAAGGVGGSAALRQMARDPRDAAALRPGA